LRDWSSSSAIRPSLQGELVARDRLSIYSRAPFLPTKRPFQGGLINVVQERREPATPVSLGDLVHPLERQRQYSPALRPDLGSLRRVPFKPTPSLHRLRGRLLNVVRRLHWYYESVRLPASARCGAPVVPRNAPPSGTSPTDPAGPPGFRRCPFVRDAAHDPGGATPSRLSTMHMLPSWTGTHSASTTFSISRLTPHPARLLPTLPTRRYHSARKTRSWPARYGFGQTGLSPASHLQLCPAHSQNLLNF